MALDNHASQTFEVTDPDRARAAARADRARHESRQSQQQHSHSAGHISLPDAPAPQPELRAVSASGRTLNADEITGDTLLRIGSEQIHVRLAESIGLVTRAADGSLSLTAKGREYGGLGALPAGRSRAQSQQQTQAQQNAPRAEQQPEKAPEPSESDKALDTALAAASSALEGVPADTIAEGLNMILEDGEVNINVLAATSGLHSSELSQKSEAIIHGFEAEASSYLEQRGVADVGIFRAWAQEMRSDSFKAAVHGHVVGRNLDGYEALAVEFNSKIAAYSDPASLRQYEGDHVLEGGVTVKVYTASDGITYIAAGEHSLPLVYALMLDMVAPAS